MYTALFCVSGLHAVDLSSIPRVGTKPRLANHMSRDLHSMSHRGASLQGQERLAFGFGVLRFFPPDTSR